MPIPPPTPLPSTDVIYDLLIREIEPDLVSNQLPLLKEKYKTETPEEKQVRMQRYQRAHETFKEELTAYLANYKEKVEIYKKVVLRVLEEKSREKEQEAMMTSLTETIANNT